MKQKRKLSWLAAPYGLWMLFFTVVPLGIVVYYAFTDSAGNFSLDNLSEIGRYVDVFFSSLGFGIAATALCLLIGYPIAYSISRMKGSRQQIMVMLVMIPQWMNFLIRTYAWMTLLEDTGLINTVLGYFGLSPLHMINTDGAILLGLVYTFLPYMILPLYSIMTKIDNRIIEAAQDLGANGIHTFIRVILPLSVPGIISGITMVFVPSLSAFFISELLGGGKTMLIGNIIEMKFLGQSINFNVGSMLSLILMVLVLICMFFMNKFGDEDGTGALVA